VSALSGPFVGPSFSAEQTIAYVEDQDESEKALGLIMGQILVTGLEKACPQVRENMKMSPPDQITILLSDQSIAKFSNAACSGKCDMVQMNNIIASCKKLYGKPNCFIYGAGYQNKFHVLAVDAYGVKLQVTCK
jgi:hypothetical protein